MATAEDRHGFAVAIPALARRENGQTVIPAIATDAKAATGLGQQIAKAAGVDTFEIQYKSVSSTHYLSGGKWHMCDWQPTGDMAGKKIQP